MFHDCLFLPDPGLAKVFFDARQQVATMDRRGRARRFDVGAPLVVGTLLLFLPPVGVTALWASRHFSMAAKIAVTLYGTALTVLLAVLLARA